MWQFAPLWDTALTFERFVGESAERSLWSGIYRTARVPRWATRRAARLGRRYRLVILVEDWCGDASSTVPVIQRWAEETGTVEVRLLRRDEHLEVMDRYLTDGARSIPLVIVLTEGMEEIGRWGPRPAELQAWVMEERKARTSQAYFPDMRRWYARDKGESTVREILDVMEGAAAD